MRVEQVQKMEAKKREKQIVQVSIVGILANVFLAAFKAFVGLASHSIAILMDAVNNLSDAASSLITIIGTKLAAKQPDKKHPFGYGRIEYLSALVISVLVLYAGVTSFVESVKKIIHPDKPEYGTLSLVIVAVAVIVKIVLGQFVKKRGKTLRSDALVNSGEDALHDSVISIATLVSAFVFLMFQISLESYLGAIISLVIIKSGIDMIKDAVSQILGERADIELARKLKEAILKHEEVKGVYDLVLHNYGPDAFHGSVHIEVLDTFSVEALDELLRQITLEIYHEFHILLTAIGVYTVNTSNEEVIKMREKVRKIAFSEKHVQQIHAFYVSKEKKKIRFDLVVSLEATDRIGIYDRIMAKVQAEYPEYQLEIALDTDFTEV